MIITIEIPNEVRQIIPVLCGALLSVSFGMMLGWPSLAYPFLLNDDVTPIPISLDETALIAGFLLEGNSIGSLFSTSKFLPSKLAVCLCSCLQITGWILMFYSADIFWFLASRSSIGFATGYGLGQLKRYIKETCEPDLANTINTYMPMGLSLGVLLMFIMGAYVDFRSMAIYSIAVPVFCLVSFALFPKYVKPEGENRLNNMMSVQNKNDLTKNMTPIEDTEDSKPVNVFKALKCRESRNTLLLMFLLIFVQQYCGGPAHIVYSQIIFTSTRNPYPKICSIIYAIFFVINMFVALRHAKKVNRKTNMLVSTAACILSLSLVSLYFYLRRELLELNELFAWSPLFLLILYNFFHTFSYGVLPLLLVSENMPKYSVNIGSKFWTIHFSMSAVISTKIFQVLYGLYGMWIGYLFFVAVLVGGFFVLIFVDDFTPKKKTELHSPRVENIESGHVNTAFEITENHTKC